MPEVRTDTDVVDALHKLVQRLAPATMPQAYNNQDFFELLSGIVITHFNSLKAATDAAIDNREAIAEVQRRADTAASTAIRGLDSLFKIPEGYSSNLTNSVVNNIIAAAVLKTAGAIMEKGGLANGKEGSKASG